MNREACRVGESWTSTFPTFHLLLFCVITALCGALSDREGGKTEVEREVDGRREKRNSKTNYFLMCKWDRVGKLWTIRTYRQPDGQMDGWMTPSQEHKPARTAARGSAESHTYMSSKVCEEFKMVWLIFWQGGVCECVLVCQCCLRGSKSEKCQCKENCETALAFEYLVTLVFCKLVHQRSSASSMAVGAYFSKVSDTGVWRLMW